MRRKTRRYHREGRGAAGVSCRRHITGFADLQKLRYLRNVLAYARAIPGDGTLETALLLFSAQDKKAVMKKCLARADRQGLEKERLFGEYLDGSDSLDESIVRAFKNRNLQPLIFREVCSVLSGLALQAEARATREILPEKLRQVCETFGLNQDEKEILLFLFLRESRRGVDRVFDELCDLLDIDKFTSAVKSGRPLAIMTGLEQSAVIKALSGGSNLVQSGILNADRSLAGEIINFLHGSGKSPMSQKYVTEFSDRAVPLQYHTIDPVHVETVKKLLRHKVPSRGLNILLYGRPGTGKTEFARSLGRDRGMTIYEIKNRCEDDADTALFRHRAVTATQRMTTGENTLIVVDEADSMLNAAPEYFSLAPVAEKGQINTLLDESRACIIWITNRYDGIDDSTRRRFDYSIGFDTSTFAQRRALWQACVKKYAMGRCLSPADIDRLALQYETSAGGIDLALRNASKLYRGGNATQDAREMIENIVKAHLKILGQKETHGHAAPHSPSYSLDGLNIKGGLERTLELVDRFNGCWSPAGKPMAAARNMNILLYGPPGTGKTEFARYVARRMKRRLMVKRASDLLSCWVGATEQSIRQAFTEAENDGAILFIDEADSFFADREGARHSWEITQVNEMLTNMENFRGMLVCATNFRQALDAASIRRFAIKLEFDYLTPQGAAAFYTMFLRRLSEKPLPARDKEALCAISCLSPGDFKIINQRYRLLDDDTVTHREMIDALKQEVACKKGNAGKRMGFGKA